MAYTKQTWNDLPNTTTPINATRLNHIEDGVYDAHNLSKDVITITLSANTTLSVSASYVVTKIPMNNIKAHKDNNNVFTFSNSDNTITINKAGYYLVSENIMANNSTYTQTTIGSLERIRNNSSVTLFQTYDQQGRSGYITLAHTPVLQYFNVGDKIYAGITASAASSITIGGSNMFSWLTIQEM